MKITRIIVAASMLGAATLMTACETTNNTGTFSSSEAGRAQSVQMGMVYAVREVSIQNAPSRVGTTAGAALGGVVPTFLPVSIGVLLEVAWRKRRRLARTPASGPGVSASGAC